MNPLEFFKNFVTAKNPVVQVRADLSDVVEIVHAAKKVAVLTCAGMSAKVV